MGRLSISFSKDRMIAYLSGSVPPGTTEKEALGLINEALSERGVVHGAQHNLKEAAAATLTTGESADSHIVTIGDYPDPGKLAGARFTVTTYEERDLPAEARSGKPVHYVKLLSWLSEPFIVREQQPVGTFGGDQGAVVGTNVFGKPQPVEEGIEPMSSPRGLGKGLITRYGSTTITAMLTGILVRKRDVAYIVPVDLDGAAFVRVADNRLKAYLSLLPPGPGGKEVILQDILSTLEENEIRQGVDQDAIRHALETLEKTGRDVSEVCIAEGTPPVDGEDARIEYGVNLAFTHKPAIQEDGSVDYYSVHAFETVVEGQTLARLYPHTQGTPGTDVYGNKVEARDGNPLKIARGKNVSPDDENPLTWNSQKTGHVYLRNNKLVVEEVLRISSNVDFHTGNVDFMGDVEIEGDVCSGFSVKASGNIVVQGTVEDAHLDAGQSVVVHGGFVGKGRGRIRAERDVVVKHVRNQSILARKNLMVSNECVDANLVACNLILVEGRKSFIVGGIVVARDSVKVHTLGNKSRVSTRVSAGIDPFVQEMLREVENEIKDLEEERTKLLDNIKRLSANEVNRGGLSSRQSLVRAKLAALGEKHESRLRELHKYREEYKKSVYNLQARVSVAGTVYPGVTVEIADLRYPVHDQTQRCLYCVESGAIAVRPA